MRVLVTVPLYRNIPVCLQSVHNLEWNDEIRFSFERGGDKPCRPHISDPVRSENSFRKALIHRQLMIGNDFDAMLQVDDDMLIPPDTLLKLAALDAPVAYGLYVWRNEPHHWNIVPDITEDRLTFYTPDEMTQSWSKVVTVAGVGTGCVLIRRDVLERIAFQRRGMFAHDYYFAVDCYKAGVQQVCDTSVICGHVEHELVYWPTIEGYEIRDL